MYQRAKTAGGEMPVAHVQASSTLTFFARYPNWFPLLLLTRLTATALFPLLSQWLGVARPKSADALI